MKDWMIRNALRMQKWMIGRYGTDELSIFLLRLALIIMLISIVPALRILDVLGWVLAGISIYRICSKKITARARERDMYMRVAGRITPRISVYKRMWRERKTHRYYRCPSCKTMVRVPKGKGKIEITCTKCRHKIIRKS